MKRAVKVVITVGVLAVVVGGATRFFGKDDTTAEIPSVTVERSNLVDRALAVGTIEPRVQISVKSQLSGVVSRQFAQPGDYVAAGAPLLEIRPTPTPQEVVDAKRALDLRKLELASIQREFQRQEALKEKSLISASDFEAVQRRHDEAQLQVTMAAERLELLESGRLSADSGVATVIKAPITGFVLDKSVEIGDPVVPLTSFQAGTVLMTMADMDDLIFRGTVDEIDVGRLIEGMPVELKVGALPAARVEGTLAKIWLKARKEENSTVFPIEIALGSVRNVGPEGALVTEDDAVQAAAAVLRAGYSANAEIIVSRRDSVLVVPERVITFEDGSAFVDMLLADNSTERRSIQTGLSDAIHIEVVSGLDEGARVAEKKLKVIE